MDVTKSLVTYLRRNEGLLFIGPNIAPEHENIYSEKALARHLASVSGLQICKYLGGQEECKGLSCVCHWSTGRIAQYCDQEYGTYHLIDSLKRYFGQINITLPIYEMIPNLHARFSAIITFNYDEFLEQAFDRSNVKYSTVTQPSDIPFRAHNYVTIYKVRGCIKNPETILITEQDYYKASIMGERDLLNIALNSELSSGTPLFVGCNLNDGIFRELYHKVSYQLKQFQRMGYAIQSPLLLDEAYDTIQNELDRIEANYWRGQGVIFLRVDPVRFLKEVETKLSETDIDEAHSVISEALTADRQLDRAQLRLIEEKLDELERQSVLTLEMRQLLAESVLDSFAWLDPELSRWLDYLGEQVNMPELTITLLEKGISKNGDDLTSFANALENAVHLAGEQQLRSAAPLLIRLLKRPINPQATNSHHLKSIQEASMAALAEILSVDPDQEVIDSLLNSIQNVDIFRIFLRCLPPEVAEAKFEDHFLELDINEKRRLLENFSSLNNDRIFDAPFSKLQENFLRCLRVALHSPEVEIFRDACRLLSLIEQDTATDYLEEIAFTASLPNRREEALYALGNHKTEKSVDILRGFLAEEGWQSIALKVLIKLISDLKFDNDEKVVPVKRMAIGVLASAPEQSKEALKLLTDFRCDSDYEIRGIALEKLSDFYAKEELADVICANLNHEDEGVRYDALSYLEKQHYTYNEIFELLHACFDVDNYQLLETYIKDLQFYGTVQHRNHFLKLIGEIEERLAEEPIEHTKNVYEECIAILNAVIGNL